MDTLDPGMDAHSRPPDTKTVRRKVLLSMLASPTTLMPFVAGVTVLLGTWALGWRADLGVLMGLAGILGGAGMFASKLFLGAEKYTKQALDELHEESQEEHERELDELGAALLETSDQSDEAALKDLRALAQAFEELNESQSLRLNASSTLDIMSGVRKLYGQCIESLKQTLKLWLAAAKMNTKAARRPLLQKRVEILQDVNKSIGQLGTILVTMENLTEGDEADTQLARIRDELNQNLDVAREVEERMKQLETELGSRIPD